MKKTCVGYNVTEHYLHLTSTRNKSLQADEERELICQRVYTHGRKEKYDNDFTSSVLIVASVLMYSLNLFLASTEKLIQKFVFKPEKCNGKQGASIHNNTVYVYASFEKYSRRRDRLPRLSGSVRNFLKWRTRSWLRAEPPLSRRYLRISSRDNSLGDAIASYMTNLTTTTAATSLLAASTRDCLLGCCSCIYRYTAPTE